ncbi:ATP synthase membrane subunit K, mitochondrial isoform X1 [Gallus gallus]|uniref:ATP synthase membrane subunit K, mitochondrial isoform X1 n=1 Tax=Gallus gallus TaxID=9031 RepID=UPI001F0252D1|nr:ATP synthase membrane subunit K, mitochondrial isoform X1 [Gallus gallus]
MKVQPGAVSSKHLPQPLVQTGPHRSAHRDPDCPPQARPQRRHSHHSKPHECRSPRAPGSSTPGEGQRLKGGRKCRAILKTGRGGGMEEASCFRGQPISALRGGCARKWAPAILWEGAEEGQSEAVKKEVAEGAGGYSISAKLGR